MDSTVTPVPSCPAPAAPSMLGIVYGVVVTIFALCLEYPSVFAFAIL